MLLYSPMSYKTGRDLSLDTFIFRFDQSHHLPSREMPEHEKNCDAREIVERLTVLTTEEPAWKKRIPKINAGSTEVKVKAAQPPTGLQAPPPGADPLYKGTFAPRFHLQCLDLQYLICIMDSWGLTCVFFVLVKCSMGLNVTC